MLGRRGLGSEAVDRAALERAVRRQRHVEVHADLIREVDPEHEVGKQGEEARVGRQCVLPRRLAGDVDGAPETAGVVHRAVVGERLLGGRGVHELDVIGLDEVLHQELPVRGDLPEVDGDDMVDAGEVDPVELSAKRGDEVLQRRRGSVEVDEDPVVPCLRSHRHQSVLVAIEAGRRRARVAAAEVRGEPERAVESIGPRVIGTADRPSGVAGLVDELEAPVAAHVVKGTQALLGIAHQQHRLAGDRDRRHVAGPGKLVRETGEDPAVGEDALVLEREERLVRVGRGRQSAGQRHRSLECSQTLGTQD